MLFRVFRSFRQFLRDNFFAGVFVTVPFAVTIACLAWVWQQIDDPLRSFFNLVTGSAKKEGPWTTLLHAITESNYSNATVPLLGLVLIIILVMIIGMIMRSIIGRVLLKSIEAMVTRLPVIGMLYGSVKQLGDAFITKDGHSKFQRAVAVQFPYPGSWAIGFVTGPGENVLKHVPANKNTVRLIKMLTVFVPTSPLPTQGFMVLVPESETMELDMPVQDALKMVVSGGMIAPMEDQKIKNAHKEAVVTAAKIQPNS